jgi:hypothetical protein
MRTINKIPSFCIECGQRFFDIEKLNACESCLSPICDNCIDDSNLCQYCMYDSFAHEQSELFV